MKLGKKISEDKVVTAFLEAELFNDRHFDKFSTIKKLLPSDVSRGTLLYNEENEDLRLKILKNARGWKNKELFYGFPNSLDWFELKFDITDLVRVKYINYSYWNKLSGNSSSPIEAAKNIQKGMIVFSQSNDLYINLNKAIKKGSHFPPIIFVAENIKNKVTILEGHARITAIALAESIPENQKFYVGIGKGINKWTKEDKS